MKQACLSTFILAAMWPVPPLRSGSLITRGETYADKSGAPNNASYPGVNQMDCDSCHVPHGAGNYEIDSVNGKTIVPAILDSPNSTNADFAGLCQECHSQ